MILKSMIYYKNARQIRCNLMANTTQTYISSEERYTALKQLQQPKTTLNDKDCGEESFLS